MSYSLPSLSFKSRCWSGRITLHTSSSKKMKYWLWRTSDSHYSFSRWHLSKLCTTSFRIFCLQKISEKWLRSSDRHLFVPASSSIMYGANLLCVWRLKKMDQNHILEIYTPFKYTPANFLEYIFLLHSVPLLYHIDCVSDLKISSSFIWKFAYLFGCSS